MKITSIEDMHADGGFRVLSFLKISTDEGIVGWSEFHEGMAGQGLTAVIRQMATQIIGSDPRDVGPMEARLYTGSRMVEGGIAAQAIAAITNACLDIKGKAAGLPVHDLFGGAHRMRLPVYWSHCGSYRARHASIFEAEAETPPLRTLDDVVTLGREVVARGFKAAKTNILTFDENGAGQYRPGFMGGEGHPELNLTPKLLGGITDLMAAFRQGLGPDAGLLLDLNYNFQAAGVRRIARALEPYDMYWLEVDMYDAQALAFIRGSTTTPIASLEAIYGPRAFLPFLQAQAVDAAIVDVQWNGFLVAMRLAELARTYEINVAAHNAHGYLSSLMGAHMCAAIPNFRIMEFDVDEVPWMDKLVTTPPRLENGEYLLPGLPGWGCDIVEDEVLARPPRNVGPAQWLLDYHRRKGVLS